MEKARRAPRSASTAIVARLDVNCSHAPVATLRSMTSLASPARCVGVVSATADVKIRPSGCLQVQTRYAYPSPPCQPVFPAMSSGIAEVADRCVLVTNIGIRIRLRAIRTSADRFDAIVCR